MLTTTRENVLAAVERMGAAHCCYSHRDWLQTCDCKYGANDLGPFSGGEQTGCPELRCIKLALSRMTDAEWDALMRGEPILTAAAAEARVRDVVQRAAVLVEMADLFWDRGDPRKRIATSIRTLIAGTKERKTG